jgi:hypothetical protein
VLADDGVDEHRVRTYLRARRDSRRTTNDGEGMDDRVRFEHGVGVDPGRLRVDDRHAGQHVRFVDPVSERSGCGSQLCSCVHTLGLHRISSLVHRNTPSVRDEERDRIRQIELTLRVVRREPIEHRPQPIRSEHVDGRVDLSYRALLRRGISMFDDRRKPAVAVSQHSPVLLGIVGLERKDGRPRAVTLVRVDELGEEPGREERRVAGEHEHVLCSALECAARATNRIAGAERHFLNGDLHAVERVGSRRRCDYAGWHRASLADSSTQSTIRRWEDAVLQDV